MLILLVYTGKVAASSLDSAAVSSFRTAYLDYLTGAESQINEFPSFTWLNDSLIYWNDRSLRTLPPPIESDSIIYENTDGFYYLLRDEKEGKITTIRCIPLWYRNPADQRSFIQQHFKHYDVHTEYAIPPFLVNKQVLPAQIASTLEVTSLSTAVKKPKSIGIAYLIFLNGIILMVFVFAGQIRRTLGNFWGTMVVVFTALTIRIFSMQPFIERHTSGVSFFSAAHFNESFQSSIGDLLLNTLLFAIIGIFLLHGLYNERSKKGPELRQIMLTVANYTAILFGIQLLAFVTKNLLVEANIPLTLDRIFAINWSTTLVVLSVLLFVTGLFFLNYLLIHNISKRHIEPAKRLMALVGSAIISLPVFFMLDLGVSPFGFYILAFAYIVLKDVFSDTRAVSISWMVIWMILITGGVSLFLYNYYQESMENQKLQAARSVLDISTTSETRSFQPLYADIFDHAIYESGKITSGSVGKYPSLYMIDTLPPVGKYAYVSQANRSEVVYRITPEKWIVVGKSKASFTNSISLFSFVFVNLFFLVLVLLVLNSRTHWLPEKWGFEFQSKASLRRRFQWVLFSVLILSFISIGWFTLFFIKDINNQQGEENIRADITQADATITQAWRQNPEVPINDFFDEFALIFGRPVWLFDEKGQSTSNENQVGGDVRRIPFEVYRTFQSKRSNVDFLSTPFDGMNEVLIAPLRIQENIVGYLGLPVDQSNGTSSSINDFLGTLLNMYIFMLIIAGSIALAFADSITRPLSTLSKRFREFKLGAKSEPIEWKSSDELGALITDYNRMMSELDDSAKLLAITEREMAWREMAKQVAHEIKNPLTPMKLSIQHLQYAIKRSPKEAENIVDRVSNTLVEQIDNLSNIASEFSNFANMPKAENEKIVLNEVVASVHDLFRKRDDMDIQLYVPIDDIFVFADRNHLVRIMNNLVKNAIQAIPPDRRGSIEIKVYKETDHAIVRVRDNGTGIPENIRDKVFKPNFTSKNSGTGLGLAICANMVDTFNGKIYFESETGKGTDFFIEIPLMHMKDNFEEQKRVTL